RPPRRCRRTPAPRPSVSGPRPRPSTARPAPRPPASGPRPRPSTGPPAPRVAGSSTRPGWKPTWSGPRRSGSRRRPSPTPAAPPAPTTADHGGEADTETVLTENPEASLFADDDERSEWAPPGDLPTWWTRGGAQG